MYAWNDQCVRLLNLGTIFQVYRSKTLNQNLLIKSVH